MAKPLDNMKPNLRVLEPQGPAQRHQVLMLHGAWQGAWAFEKIGGLISAQGFRTHLLNLPGHGQDNWELPGITSLNDYALVAARATRQVENPVLIGHSMGGWLVQKLLETADLPAVLLAPLPGRGLPLTGLTRFAIKGPGAMFRAMTFRPVYINTPRTVAGLLLGREPDPGYLAKLGPEPFRGVLEMGMGLCRARPNPGRAPRLIVAGDEDALMPLPSMKRLSKKLNARLVIMKNSPHVLWRGGREEETAEIILSFLGSL